MDFEWDPGKEARNVEKHGLDFMLAAGIFASTILTAEDRRSDYGERRYVSIGVVDDKCLVVVWTRREATIRIISAWKGGRDERERYEARLAEGRAEDDQGR